MTRPQVTFPDAQRAVVDLLTELLDDAGETVTVAVGVPNGWKPGTTSHLEVASDGTPDQTWPVVAYPTIRIVARASTTTEAKRLAALAEGLLVAYGGGDTISTIRPLTGVLPARDDQTNAEIASVTLRVAVRSEPANSGS
jgi:hypothetical protein